MPDVLQNIWEIVVKVWGMIMDNIVILNIIFSLVIIFFERRQPQVVWAWLLCLYFVPVAGFILYLVVGQDYHKSKMFKQKELDDEIRYAVRRQEERIQQSNTDRPNSSVKKYQDLVMYNLEAGQAVLTGNNDIQVYTDGKEKFRALVHELSQAKRYIFLQYYIIRDDEVWHKVESVLIRKAKEGLDVYVLFDSMGCRGMSKRSWDRLKNAGVHVAEFFPAYLGHLQLRINYRNHRKIVVIDGRVGFVGGYNVAREYIGREKKFGYWRDTHLCIEGPAAASLAVRFILDWNYAAKENLFQNEQLFRMPKYERNGHDAVQIISSGPDSKYKVIHDNYLHMIHRAKRHIYIQTPYFIPDESILDALKIAVQAGVDVRIMIPCKPDHPFVYWATYSYIGEMALTGAHCYIYNNGFLHAKTMTVDGMIACVGTANMDIRSFGLNFEVNATIFSLSTAKKLEEAFEKDMELCTLLTEKLYKSRNIVIRFKEQVCRLLSPLL